MARAPLKFRQSDIERARRAANATGGGRVEITPGGSIVIYPADDTDSAPLETSEWDEEAAEVLPGVH